MNVSLLELEKENPEQADYHLEELYRNLHNMKGSSRTIGLNQIEQFVHKMEEIIRVLRENKMKFSQEVSDLLFVGFDALQNMVDRLAEGIETDIEGVEILLKQFEQLVSTGGMVEPSEKIAELSNVISQEEDQKPQSAISKLPSQVARKIKEEYLIEMEEMIEKIEKHLVELDKLGFMNLSESQIEDFIDVIAREIHTIKGTSGVFASMGFTSTLQVKKVSHEFENLLEVLKTKPESLNQELVDLLFDYNPLIEQMLVIIRDDRFPEQDETTQAQISLYLDRIQQMDLLEPGEHAGDAAPPVEATIEADDPLLQIEDIDQEIIQTFKQEALQSLSEAEQLFTSLTQEPKNLELLNSLFRIIYAIQGSANFFNLEQLLQVAEKLVTLLDLLRKKEVVPSERLLEIIFNGFDLAKIIVNNTGTQKPVPINGQEVIIKLEEHLEIIKGEEKASAAKVGKSESPKLIQPGKSSDTEEAAKKVEKGGKAGKKGGKVKLSGIIGRESRSLRVDTDKLDNLMNFMGELVIIKSRLDDDLKDFHQRVEELQGIKRSLLDVHQENKESIQLKELQEQILSYLKKMAIQSGFFHEIPTISNEMNQIVSDQSKRNSSGKADQFQVENLETSQEVIRLSNELNDASSNIIETTDQMDRITSELQEGLQKLRMLPISTVFSRFPRLVRDLSRTTGKKVELVLLGQETEVDKMIIDKIADPLMHLIRNAIDHGIESSENRKASGKNRLANIILKAYHEGNQIVIEVSDDGKGIDAEIVKEKAVEKGLISGNEAKDLDEQQANNLIFMPGFSTAEDVTDISGRGVGMDVVKTNIQQLKGTIAIVTSKGKGTTFIIKLPLTLAIMNALLVKVSGEMYAIPLSSVLETITVSMADIRMIGNREVINVRESVISLVRLVEIVNIEEKYISGQDFQPVIIVGSWNKKIGILVDELLGRHEIVLKSLGEFLPYIKFISGGTILGDGNVVLILDVPSVINSISTSYSATSFISPPAKSVERLKSGRYNLLVVDDSAVIRRQVKDLLESDGFIVDLAVDGVDGLEKAKRKKYDLITTDIMMPRMNGIEFTRELRAHVPTSNIPILVVSSKGEKEDIFSGLEAGANEYLIKPFQKNSLLGTIKRQLGII